MLQQVMSPEMQPLCAFMAALSALSSSLQCRLKWLDIELRNERINMLLRDDSHSALKGLLSFLKAP
jgi:hypothetical protein